MRFPYGASTPWPLWSPSLAENDLDPTRAGASFCICRHDQLQPITTSTAACSSCSAGAIPRCFACIYPFAVDVHWVGQVCNDGIHAGDISIDIWGHRASRKRAIAGHGSSLRCTLTANAALKVLSANSACDFTRFGRTVPASNAPTTTVEKVQVPACTPAGVGQCAERSSHFYFAGVFVGTIGALECFRCARLLLCCLPLGRLSMLAHSNDASYHGGCNCVLV